MNRHTVTREAMILLVEDNPGDVLLVQEALQNGEFSNQLHSVNDGVEAVAFLRRQPPFADAPRPDMILLDLNLPRMSGHEVLAFIKTDQKLKSIPVIVLTSSKAELDIVRSYEHYANCYITKPVDLDKFMAVIQTIDHFWLKVVVLSNPDE